MRFCPPKLTIKNDIILRHFRQLHASSNIIQLTENLVCVVLLYIVALNLFDNGRDEAVFLIPVGSGEPFHRQLATNSRTDQLVTGSVRSIEVTLNGGYDDDDLERIAINKDRAAVIITIIGNLYRYVLSGSPATTNYSILLSSLAYVSNLNSDSLAESPRNITITAYGGNSSSVTAVANIMLVPANLEAPVFQFNPIEVNLAENAMTGSLVTTINASDPEGHPVTFSFNESSPLFNISSSGQVIVLDLAALDYENKAHRIFNLVVIAMDNDPISRRSSSATLTVSLYNLNDNPPIFTQPIYTFSVVEEAAGAIVGVILATDADGANLNALRYDFLPADTGLTFSLNRVTGEISVRLALDYEDRTNYTFQVTATDSSFTSSTEVVVNVVDVADNRPVITPFQNTIIVDLDTENNGIALHEGTDGPLIVHDDSAILVSGYANITVLRSGILETFPNEYGVCKCTNSVCFDVFALCGTSSNNSLQQDLFSGVTTASSAGPALVSGLNFQVYTFNGRNDLSNNWLEIPSIVKTQFLQRTDNFTVSFWIRIPIGSGSSYILTFELGRSRYFSLYESSAQTLVLYYFRDNIPGFVNDDGRDTQVALTFFYDTAVLPSGLRDNQWHFVTLSVDFPSVVLNVDGYVHRPTRGSYRNQFDSRVDLVLLTDGNSYNLPAPILTKSQTQIDAISGKIGGSARGNQFSLGGQIRQITLTDLFDENTVSCLASCNNRIGIAPSASVSSSISTLYNPVARALYFSGAASPSQYTTLLQSLVYYSNGFLPPEELGEIHVISISISDEVDFGSIAQISVVGRSNQHDPVLDSNGDSVDGVDFQVDFHENDMHQVSIVSPQVFISDDDIGSRLVWLTATIVNPQLSNADELLSLVNNPPSALNVSGVNTYSINFTAVDSFQATANIFITALLDVRYSNFANEPVGVNRIIRLTVSDGLRTGSAITTVHILTVNDPPVLLFSGSTTTGLHTTVQYNESSTPIHLVPSLILVDPDSLHMVEAHVWIEQVFDEGNESIAFVSSLLPSEVSCSPFSCNGTDIRITGISAQHHYQALLRTLRYVNVQQFADFPNLSDRVVYITVSDGETSSDPMFHVLIDFIPINPHTILELAAPDQNFTTSFMKGQAEPIKCYGLVRVVDPSIVTFDSVIVTIRDNLPEGVSERDELTITTSTLEDISVEINTILKRITFSTVASTDQYIAAIQQIRYFNPEIKPYPINRFVDFLIVPGRDAPNDHAHCEITITNNSANSSMSVNVFQTEVDQPSRTVTLSSQTTAVFTGMYIHS